MGLSTRSIKAQMGKTTTGVRRLLVNEFGGHFWRAKPHINFHIPPYEFFYSRTMEMSMALKTGRHLDAMLKGVPLPFHRHATLCGSLPWMDVDSEQTHPPSLATPCPHPNCGIYLQLQSILNRTYSTAPRPGSTLQNSTFHHHNCRLYHVDI
jgi:hypothetical protein